MLSRNTHKNKKNKAFTLLEILLVIAAIGILAAIVIVAINPQRQLAQVRDSARQSDLNTLNSALQQYLIDTGSRPSAIAQLPTNVQREICAGGVSESDCQEVGRLFLEDALVPEYIAAIPQSPSATGSATGYFVYRTAGDRLAFVTEGENIDPITLNVPEDTQMPFVLRVKTDNTGTSEDNQFTLPLAGGGYNYTIDWGDGTIETDITSNANNTHTYNTPGTYDISITGDFPRIHFNGQEDRRKAIELVQWGDIQWGSMANAFVGTTEMQVTASDAPNLSNVTILSSMFRDSGDVSNIDFNQWDVSGVSLMSLMFQNSAISGDLDLSGWNTSSLTQIQSMFQNTSNLGSVNLSGWDVSGVDRTINMFFNSAVSGELDLSTWDTSSLTQMQAMFANTSNLETLNLSGWDVSGVTRADGMFQNSGVTSIDFTDWDTSNIERMTNMFRNTAISNISQVSSWNVSSADQMPRMFQQVNDVPDVSSWNVSNVTNMNAMFLNSGLTNQQYQDILTSWSQLPVQSGVSFHAGNAQYSTGTQAARDTLINTFGWDITDGGLE